MSQGIDLSSAGRIPRCPLLLLHCFALPIDLRTNRAALLRELLESLPVDICCDDHHRLPSLFDLTSTSRAVNIAAACIHSFGGVRIALRSANKASE